MSLTFDELLKCDDADGAADVIVLDLCSWQTHCH